MSVEINENDLKSIIKECVNRLLYERSDSHNILDIETLFHFSLIPEEELRKQYVDLSFIVSSSGYGGKFMGVNGKILKEEASSTLSIEETRSQIQSKFNFKDWQFATQVVANNIQLVILYPSIFNNTKLIKQSMAACGWSLAYKNYIVKDKMVWKAMSFDPMFQDNVANEARQFRYLYHWTPSYNFTSIMTNGLSPKSENKLFNYPNRLHLIKGNAKQNEIINIGKQLCGVNTRKKNDGSYILFCIDLTKVPFDTEIYYDPRYEWGYYTKVGISPEAIKPIFGYNFKKNTKIDL